MAVLSSPLQYISGTPLVTRIWTLGTIFFSVLYFWLRWQNTTTPYLTLIPGASIFYPWTFLTSALVETSVLELFVTLLVVPPSLRYLEKLWGAVETSKFIVVNIGIPNVIAFAFNWIEFMATSDAGLFLYGMQYHGQMALQTAILVAFTQIIPEHQVQVFGVVKTRVKHLPMAYVTLSTVLCLLGFQCPYIVIQFGWISGWFYLRFYKKNSGDMLSGGPLYGDRSDTFAFVQWFPPFLHYPIGIASDIVYKLATKLHLIPLGGADVESGGYAPLPGGARAEAERRRAMALKALDQRMANASSGASSVPAAPKEANSAPAPVSADGAAGQSADA